MHVRILSLALLSGLSVAAPCYGRLNDTYKFEEVCYKQLFNGTDGFSLREYASGATLVSYDASDAITVYQEALMETSFYVIEYFIGPGNALNKSLLSSRTVPLALRPPSAANPTWRGTMALAPSLWPAGKTPPKPAYGVELLPLGGKRPVLLAVQRASTSQSPQPSDFDALCAGLRAAVASQLPAYAVDDASPFTPTHARYFGFEFFGQNYDYECWLGVKKA